MEQRQLSEGTPLVTKAGVKARCPFRAKSRCTTACPLATEIETGEWRPDGAIDWERTGDWQCSLSVDGQAMVEEGKWRPAEEEQEDVVARWKQWKAGRKR